ncbi:unnamed protein product [Prorocentrum cordatum]|uniref:Uncharacterized protein n=1 Tax=Prorocentrum cordatum TaxID=2364126 RepID=A0ABN9R0T3_9DINO|nr:unnamed protein product [Polarella glacialis]
MVSSVLWIHIAGQLFFTHVLASATSELTGAMFYLTKDFSNGALIAVDARHVNRAILRGDYRFEMEEVMHVVLYDQVPLSAVSVLFLPKLYEHDVTLVYSSDDPMPEFLVPDFQALTTTQVSLMRLGLRSRRAEAEQTFFDRALRFVPASEQLDAWTHNGQGLFQFVASELEGRKLELLRDSGHALLQNQAMASERAWVHRGPEIAMELAKYIPTSFAPGMLPSANGDGLAHWLCECYSRCCDGQFLKLFLLTEPFLPTLVRLQDLVPQRLRVPLATRNAAVRSNAVEFCTRIKEQELRNRSIFRLVRTLFVPMGCKETAPCVLLGVEDIRGVAVARAEDLPGLRLLVRASGLLVMLPEVVRHLTVRHPCGCSGAALQECLIRSLAAGFQPRVEQFGGPWGPVPACGGFGSLAEALRAVLQAYVRLLWTVRAGACAFPAFWAELHGGERHEERKVPGAVAGEEQVAGARCTLGTQQPSSTRRVVWAVVWRLLWARVAAEAGAPEQELTQEFMELRQALRDGDAAMEGTNASEEAARRLALLADLYIGATAMVDI